MSWIVWIAVIVVVVLLLIFGALAWGAGYAQRHFDEDNDLE